MKKRLIIIVLLLAVLMAGIIAVVYFVSTRPVSITFEGEGYTVSILNKDGKRAANVSKSSTVRLNEGDYSYIVTGKDFDNSPVTFTVTNRDNTLTVNPRYSTEYLTTLLNAESDSITAILHSQYDTKGPFSITNLALYEKGDWAAGTISPTVDPRQLPDVYRFVLHKDIVSNNWVVIVPPTIAINKTNFKDVPEAILYSLYSK